MAVLPIHKYFSLNGALKPCSEFVAAENEGGVYEVLRVIGGIPLFLEDHLSRFFYSAELAGKQIRFTSHQIEKLLLRLISANEISEGNILISCKLNLKAFFIAHVYPDDKMYNEGVVCGLLHAERRNPNAKVFQTEVRTRANEMIADQGVYEVLLVDHLRKITEGSRSNVFFILGDSLITPPAGSVLKGITRQKTILCAEKQGIPCIEKEIWLADLPNFDALCVTGTSPKILPVKQINDYHFDVKNSILDKLMRSYNALVLEYIQTKK